MAHTVTLNWTAPTNTTVAEYDILRGTVKGEETKIGTSTTTTYVDSDPTLVEGTDYFYVVESQNSVGTSGPSNEVSVIIPFLIPNAPTNLVAVAA